MNVTPYIIFSGNCEEALNFYAKGLGGEIKDLNRFEGSPVEGMAEDKQLVMHAIFVAKGVMLMASDSGKNAPAETDGGRVHLSLNFDNIEDIDQAFNALSEGARVTMPLEDTFWGARFGMLTDKFGINWMFNYDKQNAGSNS
ncbi:MAG TPA: VOC family protein [Segetibacter sp.]|jgi:PhnB protein